MPLTFAETPLYYKDSQGQYHRIMSGADMTGYAKTDEESRPNLLDNWYFVGGGSQLGYGTFPINQRGQTSYSGAVFGIDRWKVSGAGHDVVVGSDYITYTRTALTGNPYLCQTVIVPYDGTYTFSALYRTSKSCFGLNGNNRFPVSADWNLYSITVSLTAGSNAFHVIQDYGAADGAAEVGDHIDIKAIKLELGAYQTLAHNEGTESSPNWVLNEIPDYGEELAKCQRYYIKFDRYIASGFLTNSGKEYNIPIYLPITMAGTPTVTMSGYVARTPNGYSAHTGGSWTAPTTLRVYYPNNGFVLLADTINSAVDTNNIQINYYIKDLVLTV